MGIRDVKMNAITEGNTEKIMSNLSRNSFDPQGGNRYEIWLL
jgi:hypothetical protein